MTSAFLIVVCRAFPQSLEGNSERVAGLGHDRFLPFSLQFISHSTTPCCVASDTDSVIEQKLNSVAVVRKRTIPTERPPLVGEVSVNLCG
jgi:hypothetical protein